METLGSADLWSDVFPEDLVPPIINLVLAAWDSFEPKPDPTELEVPITRRFRVRLRQQRDLRRLPVRILREVVEDSPDGEGELGRIDLQFCHGFQESSYFAFECKRCSVILPPKRAGARSQRRSLGSLYVSQGMMRFVSGQYSSQVSCGGMLAYVMDGDVSWAVQQISRSIRGNRSELQVSGGGSRVVQASPDHPGHPGVRVTSHRVSGRTFTMHHLFLPCG